MSKPNLKINEFYHIDKDFANGGKVKLLKLYGVTCIVQDPDTGESWQTMTSRLSPLDKLEEQ